MFQKFTKEDIHTSSLVKSSIQRNLKVKLLTKFPLLPIEEILPKKQPFSIVKCSDRIQLIEMGNLLFFLYEDEFVPTLKIIHKYPVIPSVQVDRGAIKFILRGADVMCPGLTSAGGLIDDHLKEGEIVMVKAEGKENALAVGVLLMSGERIKAENKGNAIKILHYLGDGLWNLL